jgi:hypothetical protein
MPSENDNRGYEVYLETADGTYVLIKESFNAFRDIASSWDYTFYTLDVLDLVNTVIIMNEV